MPALIATAVSHRGALGESAARLRQALDDVMALRQTLERLRVYAMLRRDENTADSDSLARYERSIAMAIEAAEALAFVEPELLAWTPSGSMPCAPIRAWSRTRHMLDDLARRRPHVRSLEVEQVLAQSADVARAPSDAFTALDNADLDFGRGARRVGQRDRADQGALRATPALEGPRHPATAYETFTKAYLDHQHTLAALHGASVRGDVFQARVRNHATAREAALFDDNVPAAVYDTLIASVRAAQPVFARYMELRRRLLGLDELWSYDLVVPLSPEPEPQHAYREGVDLVLGGLDLLGERICQRPARRLRGALGRRPRDEGEALRGILLGRLRRAASDPHELERHDERRLHARARGRPRHAQPLRRRQPPLPPGRLSRSSWRRSPRRSTKCSSPGACWTRPPTDDASGGSRSSTASPRPTSAPWCGRRCSPSSSSACTPWRKPASRSRSTSLNDIYAELYATYLPGVDGRRRRAHQLGPRPALLPRLLCLPICHRPVGRHRHRPRHPRRGRTGASSATCNSSPPAAATTRSRCSKQPAST